MKLYTEEQVIHMLSIYMANVLLDADGKMPTVDEILSYKTPIELPSDEEIQKEADAFYGLESYNQTFTQGAKWMRDKLTNTKEK